MAAAKANGSRVTMRPAAGSRTTSRAPPASGMTIGVPQASASTQTFASPSDADGKAITSAAASNAGPGVIISFLIAGFAAGLAALCYSEMAAMIPIAGSAYTYAYAAMGELMAFLIGWDLLLAYAVSVSLVSVGWLIGPMAGICEKLTPS